MGEGFDEPRLDTILLAMPVSWKGTLAQYVGRLHRNYEGKQEVRVYDYVDIHVPMLERMYHKRLKGYSELGYQVKMSGQDASVSQIYDGQNYLVPFTADLEAAASDILIVSPLLKTAHIKAVLPVLEKAAASDISITICTNPTKDYKPEQQAAIQQSIELLQSGGITVETHSRLQHRYAVIDRSIVWYGSIDYLSYSVKDDDALRFENPDIAGELLELRNEGGQPAQMQIEQLM